MPEPRVPVNTPHVSLLRVPIHDHAELRVLTSEHAVPRGPLVNEQISQVKVAVKSIQERTTKPTAPITTAPIAMRTRVVQASAKLQGAAKEVASQGPTGNSCSKSHSKLERAMYAACFIDNKNGDAQRLESQRYQVAMFVAALAVMDMELGDVTKHRQLTNHTDPAIHRTWNTLTANKIKRLCQGVGNQIKDPINTRHLITKE